MLKISLALQANLFPLSSIYFQDWKLTSVQEKMFSYHLFLHLGNFNSYTRYLHLLLHPIWGLHSKFVSWLLLSLCPTLLLDLRIFYCWSAVASEIERKGEPCTDFLPDDQDAWYSRGLSFYPGIQICAVWFINQPSICLAFLMHRWLHWSNLKMMLLIIS